MKRNINLFINDILENIENIEVFLSNLNKEELSKNKLKRYAIIRALEIIGEATKNIPQSFREKYPKVPWRDISGFRDVVIHGYFQVNIDKVWRVIKEDLPDLKQKILKVKKDLETED